MATTTGRLICARCGSNNFDTQAACWKCGTPLAAPGAPPPAAAARVPAAPREAGVAAGAPSPPPSVAAPRPVAGVDPGVANWTGIISGLLLPYFMLPVGIVFMMLDDRRRLEVGRNTVIASLVGTLLHIFVTGLMLAPLFQLFTKVLGPVLGGEQRGAIGQSAPNWNEEAAPLDLGSSGLRPMIPPR